MLFTLYGVGEPTAGLGIGLAGTLVVSRALGHLLFDVTPTDATTYALVLLVIVGVTLAACFVPARRATTVDPLTALRAS